MAALAASRGSRLGSGTPVLRGCQDGAARKKDGGGGASASFSRAPGQASCSGWTLSTSESLDCCDLTLLLGLEVMKKKTKRD